MPKDTFLNLSEEKKKKILNAAKKEFSRVPLEEASIKNIVEEAEIARGSFYQYFESKEDLLKYMLTSCEKKLEEFSKQKLIENRGDIFQVYIDMYDFITKELIKSKDREFYIMIFRNVKASDDNLGVLQNIAIKGPFQETSLINMIDKTNLKVNNDDDLKTIIRMLYIITRKALVSYFIKKDSYNKIRDTYIKMIEYLKYGILK